MYDMYILSSCVDEAKLCQGMSLCQNNNDIRYCNSTLWDATNKTSNWTPMESYDYFERSKCSSTFQLNKTEDQYGQWIFWSSSSSPFSDSKIYNCINRLDENPFEKVEAKPWLGNETCDEDQHFTEYRRCLGQRSDTCISTSCKY